MRRLSLNIVSILLLFLCFFGFNIQAQTQENIQSIQKNAQDENQIDRPKISIIVPVYNVVKWLRECMNSLINQSFKKIEIICIDDGSTDDSGKILDEYAQKDNRIKVIHKENGGVSSARNAGLDIATGEYIAFVDPDDYVHPKTYEYAYNYAKNDNVDILRFNYRPFNDGHDNFNVNNINLDDAPIMPLLEYLKCHLMHHCWEYLFKSNLIKNDNICFPDMYFSEDTCFTLMVAAKAKKIKHIPGKFYNYRRSRVGQVTSLPSEQLTRYSINMTFRNVVNSWKSQNCLEGNESLLLNVFIRWTYAWRPDIALAHSDEVLGYLSPYVYDENIVNGCSKKARDFIDKLKKSSKISKEKSKDVNKNKKTNSSNDGTKKENLKAA